MVPMRSFVAVSMVAFSALHCSPRLGRLEMLGVVQAGQEFTVTVHANDPGGLHGGIVGCVMQLPLGVVVSDATAANNFSPTSPPALNRDTPALLALYTAEPGHYLASFDANVMATNGALTVMLQAPATAAGPLAVKVALAGDWTGWTTQGGWTALDPAGVTDFASIAGSYAGSFLLGTRPSPFVRSTNGLPTGLSSVAFGDVDGDGDDDLVGLDATSGGGLLRACLSLPGSAWQVVTTTVPPGTALAVGQFDGDGLLDVALGGHVWFGTGAGAFTAGPVFAFASAVSHVAVGDVDRDGFDDIAFVAQQSYARVIRSNGNRTFTDWSTGLPNPAAPGVAFGRLRFCDVTGDGFADVVLPHSTPRIDVYAGNGLGQWTPGTALVTSSSPMQIDVGDVTGDGRDDLVVSIASPSQLCEVWDHQGGNLWSLVPLPAIAATAATGLVLLDHDRDGWLDLAAVDAPFNGTYSMWTRMRLLRNSGPAGFVEVADAGLSTFGASTLWLATGDLDGDTFPDLAAGFHTPLVWRNTATGLSPYGAGCVGAGHAPHLAANGLPQLGNVTFALHLHDGQANGVGLLWLGFSKRYAFGIPQLPFDLTALGAPGCAVLAEQVAVRLVLHDGQGVATMPFPLPNTPSLHSLLLFAQGTALVPGANALGALFSGGLAMRLD